MMVGDRVVGEPEVGRQKLSPVDWVFSVLSTVQGPASSCEGQVRDCVEMNSNLSNEFDGQIEKCCHCHSVVWLI